MRIQRVQERSSIHAIASASTKSGGIKRARIATDHVVSTAARVIRIVDSELSVIKNIEGLSPELKTGGLVDIEMFQQCRVEVQAVRIIEIVASCISKGEPPRRHKLRWIIDERAKAPRIVAWVWKSRGYVWIGGRDAEPFGDSGIVGERNAGITRAVDHRKRIS